MSPPSIPPMRHRTHDHLFAAAGVTAALSLIGTGVTVLKGSVLEFSAWPVVGHDQPRRVTLPVAPVVLAPNGGTSSRIAAIDSGSGGTEFPTLSSLTRGQSPIGSLDFNLSAPVIVPRNGGTAGPAEHRWRSHAERRRHQPRGPGWRRLAGLLELVERR